MEYYYRDFKPSAALTELRIIQRRRRRQKMVDTATIGDGEITTFNGNIIKTYKGTVNVVRIQDRFQVEVVSCGKTPVMVPCDQIISRSVQNEKVILQFKVDYMWEECICKFYDNAEADVFNSKLPSISKPISTDRYSTDNCDTDFHDSGLNGKSEAFKNNSDTPSVEIEDS